jgi:hypothetical protein
MKIALLVHGFNVFDGGVATVGKLRPFLANAGVPYIMFDYGLLGVIGTYRKNKKLAACVADACWTAYASGHEVYAFGHSNGCAILDYAANIHNAPIHKSVYINPALEKDKVLGAGVKALDVWYSPSDRPVRLSKYLPLHPWGEMGRTGYRGVVDTRITNYNKENDFKFSSKAHSDMFSLELLPFFAPLVTATALGDDG